MDAICVPARGADSAAILGMMREYYPIEGVSFRPEIQGPALRTLLDDPTLGRVYLVRDGSEIAGYVVLTFDFGLESGGREVFIDELFITGRCRGRGLGTRVLAFVEKTCRDLGARAVHLAVAFENEIARKVYVKYGFSPTGRQMMTLPLGD